MRNLPGYQDVQLIVRAIDLHPGMDGYCKNECILALGEETYVVLQSLVPRAALEDFHKKTLLGVCVTRVGAFSDVRGGLLH